MFFGYWLTNEIKERDSVNSNFTVAIVLLIVSGLCQLSRDGNALSHDATHYPE